MREILNVWFKLGVVHTPLAQFHFFSLFLMKSRHTGISHPYWISLLSIEGWNITPGITPTGFHFWVLEGWNSSYIERGKWNAQGPRGGYVRRQIWTKHYTFQKILSIEKFLEMFKIAQLLKKKGVSKNCLFLGQFPKKCLREVLATRPKSGVKSWKVMRFWWFFFN